MAFFHEGQAFPMDQPSHTTMYIHPSQYAQYMQQPHQQPYHAEPMYQGYPFLDFSDFASSSMLHDEYDDSSEISTRPRLTKDQVENWFQNRRAKAKQQRKQEEYESQQNMSAAAGWKSESDNENCKQSVSDASSKTASPGQYSSTADLKRETTLSASPVIVEAAIKEPSWKSLERAIKSAKAGEQASATDLASAISSMPPPDVPRPALMSSHIQSTTQASHADVTHLPVGWSKQLDSTDAWGSPSAHVSDAGFDFGFDQPMTMSSRNGIAQKSDLGTDASAFIVPSEEWHSPYSVSAIPQSRQLSNYESEIAQPIPLPIYSGSRRGSEAEELTTNFGSFALRGTPPVGLSQLDQPLPIRPTEGEIDIASRRKRPRPAAITTSSLRSRSYGQLASPSPALRTNPVSGGQLRHTKSVGHALNAQYAGIRKSSLPQKSPLNIHSFAEAEAVKAEAFKNLMAQQAALANNSSIGHNSRAVADLILPNSARYSESIGSTIQTASEMSPRYKNLQSPPVTPFQSDFMMQASGIGMQAISASSQFANLVEYTPPYSAGPLTNSTCSWSDAPLHSPELPVFPTGTYMSSLPFNQEPIFQQWVLPSDNTSEANSGHIHEEKKTEFYITEFPGQKEEHLNVLQMISQQKPKNYTFANTAPSDYDP